MNLRSPLLWICLWMIPQLAAAQKPVAVSDETDVPSDLLPQVESLHAAQPAAPATGPRMAAASAAEDRPALALTLPGGERIVVEVARIFRHDGEASVKPGKHRAASAVPASYTVFGGVQDEPGSDVVLIVNGDVVTGHISRGDGTSCVLTSTAKGKFRSEKFAKAAPRKISLQGDVK